MPEQAEARKSPHLSTLTLKKQLILRQNKNALLILIVQ
jgi:hypothetical protein